MEKYRKAKLNDRDNELSKQWYVEYMFKHPENNVLVPFRKYISLKLKTGTARRMKADQLIKELNEWLAMGGNPFADESLGKTKALVAVKRILALKKVSTRKRTYTSYNDSVKKFEHFLTNKRLMDLAVEDVSIMVAQQFSDYLLEVLHLGNRSHNNMISYMSAMWAMMNKRFNVPINPWKGIDLLPEEEPSIVMFTPDELEKVSTKLRNDDFNLWLCAGLVFYCALRPQEIVRLKVFNFRLDVDGIILDGRITKNKKSSWVSIPSIDLVNDLKKLNLHNMDPEIHVFAKDLLPGMKEIAPTRIAERWRVWANLNGVSKGIYDLKHNAAGMASDAGIPLRDIQVHLRHHSLEQTEQYIKRFRKEVGPGFNERYPKI